MEMLNEFSLESVHIKNFNNIDDLRLDIKDIIIVTGKNGSGKTSIAEAIDFCLTGQVIRNVPISSVIKRGCKSTTVTIKGKYNGSGIEITRHRTQRSQKIKVTIGDGDNREEISKPKDFLEGIMRHIEFEKIYYINGHQISQFIDGTPAQTSEMIDKIFSVNTLDNIIKGLVKGRNRVMKMIETGKAGIQSIEKRKELYDHMKMSVEDDSDLEERMGSIESEVAKLEEEREKIVPKIDELDGNIKHKSVLMEHYKKNSMIRKDLEYNLEKANKNVEKCYGTKRDLDSNLKKFGEPPKRTDIDGKRDDLAKAKARMEFYKEAPSRLKSIFKGETDDDKCPACLTPGKKEIAMKNMQEIEGKQKKEMITILKQITSLKKELNDLIERERNYNEIKEKVKTADIEHQMALKIKARLKEDLKNAPASEPEYIEHIKDERKSFEMEQKTLKESLMRVRVRIEGLGEEKKRVKRAMERRRSVPKISWGKEDDAELEKKRVKLERLGAKLDGLDRTKAGFKTILSGIREVIMETINPDVIKQITNLAMKKTPITAFEMIPEVKDTGKETYYHYSFRVEINGESVPFNSLSTGQKALCFVSIILNIINYSDSLMDVIVFDEIDNCGLDKENVDVILKLIVEISKNWKVLFINRDQSTIDKMIELGSRDGIDVPVHYMPDPFTGTNE